MPVKTEIKAARELLTALHVTQGAGHTTAMIRGAQNTDNCTIIALNEAHCGRLRRIMPSHVSSISIGALANCALRGKRNPVVVDNAALEALLTAVLSAYDIALENENTRKTVKDATIQELAQEIVKRTKQEASCRNLDLLDLLGDV